MTTNQSKHITMPPLFCFVCLNTLQVGGVSTGQGQSEQSSAAASRSEWERYQISRILSAVTTHNGGSDTSTTLPSQPADERQ